MLKRHWKQIAAIAGIIVLAYIAWRLLRPAPVVEVTRPVRREVVELVIASGRLRAKRTSEVGSQVIGTVETVFIEEGDQVSQGQLIITLDRGEILRQLEQARLAVETARRQLEVTQRGALPEEIARARAELRQAERVGAARLEAARQRLRELERGGREAERRRAEAELQRARATREQAETDLRRTQELVREGAVSEAELDRARTALRQTQAAEAVAQQELALARQPGSREEIEIARAEVRAAEAEVQETTRAARAELNRLLSEPQPEDVRLARARVREAEAAVRSAQEQLDKRLIRAPISGLVTRRSVEPGQSITQGETLLVIADMGTTEILVETDEVNLPKLEVGQTATVIAPAYPRRPFRAVLTQIGPEVVEERGVVTLRLRPAALPDYARPDMTIDVNIEVERLPSVAAVPASAVIEEQDEAYVLVVENRVAQRREVRVLARGEEFTGIEGISPDTRVIVNATRVTPGERVRVERIGQADGG